MIESIIWNITEEALLDIIKSMTGIIKPMDCVGNAQIYNIMIDFTLRDYDGVLILDYDVYLKGVDSGYGYLEDGTPYDYRDGGKLFDVNNIPNRLDDFKEMAFDILIDFIQNDELLRAELERGK